MRRLTLFLIAVALVAGACGDSGTASTTTAGGNTLETLPPTSTTPTSTTPPPETTTTVDPVAAEYGSPEISGDTLPLLDSLPDPAVGQAAPVVVGTDYEGNEVTIGGGGSVQAGLFVAHWCPHCQDELPEIVQWLDQSGVQDVEFVLVTVAVDPIKPNFPPSAWIEAEGWTGPVLLDDEVSSAFVSYGGRSIPYWVFLNADGTVAARAAGAIGSDEVANILAGMANAP